MHTNISNIIDALIEVMELNRSVIDTTIDAYEPGRTLSIFKGMRKTLGRSQFPSLELEPTDGANSWFTTQMQKPEYSVQFTLTICADNQDMSVEYIGSLTRLILEMLNNPQNMALLIPNEYSYQPDVGECQTRLIDAFVSSVTYNATQQGTYRVSQWSWTGQLLEGVTQEAVRGSEFFLPTVFNDHPLPPGEDAS